MGGKSKFSESLQNNSGKMKWYGLLVYILMPVFSVVSFILGAVYFVSSLLTVNGFAALFKAENVMSKFITNAKGLEVGEKLTRAEINECGLFLFAFCLMAVALGVFTLASRSSLLFFEKKSIMMTLILFLSCGAASLVTALYLFLFEYGFIYMIPYLILAGVQIAFGIVNFVYLKKISYEFTI